MSATGTHVELICGGRDYADRAYMAQVIGWLVAHQRRRGIERVEIVSGMARGADRLGADEATRAGLHVHEFPADWDRFGRSAGYRRNEQMAEFLVERRDSGDSVGVTAFPGGRGTGHMIDIAARHGLRVVQAVRRAQ